MRSKSVGLLIVMGTLVALIVAIPVVHGAVDWTLTPNNLSSGYRVTTENFPDPVMIGDPVVAWAGTTDCNVDEVWFRWNYPEGSGLDPIIAPGERMADVWVEDVGWVKQWKNTQYPDVEGDWGIQGVFYGDEGQGWGPIKEEDVKTAIRARSFFAVPEVPIGTIIVVVAMFGALGLFALKRKPVSIKNHL